MLGRLEQGIPQVTSWDQALSGGHPFVDQESRGISWRVDVDRYKPSNARVRERRVVDRSGAPFAFNRHLILLSWHVLSALFVSLTAVFLDCGRWRVRCSGHVLLLRNSLARRQPSCGGCVLGSVRPLPARQYCVPLLQGVPVGPRTAYKGEANAGRTMGTVGRRGGLSTCPGAVIVPSDQVVLEWNHNYMVG